MYSIYFVNNDIQNMVNNYCYYGVTIARLVSELDEF